MFRLQEFIHRLEEGSFSRIVQWIFVALLIVAIAVAYDIRAFKNLSSADAMDAAQLARNLAEGRGYVTGNITPFSMYLVKQRHDEQIEKRAAAGIKIEPGDHLDEMKLRNNHPDLANAPLYPWLLSLYMKVVPFNYSIVPGQPFERYQPDLMIALFNQVLMVLCAVMVFVLATSLFDTAVAWLSMLLFVGTNLFWKFSVSGNSTMLLLLIFLGLLWSLARLERSLSLEEGTGKRPLLYAALTGVLLSLGFLTRYAFGWLLIPVALFVLIYGGTRRFGMILSLLAVCFLIVTPWLQRNNQVSGTPFGTAGFAARQLTRPFPADELPRSLDPNLKSVELGDYARKFKTSVQEILQQDLPTLGGTWMTAFFFVGLLVVFQSSHLNRVRGFVVAALGVFIIVQALGKTQLSIESPVINTENLLILLGPPVIIFGVSLFFTLLDQWNVSEIGARVILTGMFGLLVSLPLGFTLISRNSPVAYPPYFPPVFQYVCSWMRPNEQMMSDVPAAVAWYGNQQCLLWTRDPGDDFYSIYDYQKPVNALYLSPKALDAHLLTGLLKGANAEWGRPFLVNAIARAELPREFPLKYAPPGFLPENPDRPSEVLPEHLFLADRIRW